MGAARASDCDRCEWVRSARLVDVAQPSISIEACVWHSPRRCYLAGSSDAAARVDRWRAACPRGAGRPGVGSGWGWGLDG